MKKALILTCNIGNGHNQVASAIQESAKRRYKDLHIVTYDFLAHIHPLTSGISRSLFLFGLEKTPQIYGFLYEKSRKSNLFSSLLQRVLMFGSSKIMSLIDHEKPDMIISTFPLAAAATAKLKSRGEIDVDVVTIITDHSDHSFWIHEGTDRYLVGSERVKSQLVALGVPETLVFNTGIPIREQFKPHHSRATFQRKYKLDPKKRTVLVMGGGVGLFNSRLSSMYQLFLRHSEVQFLIVCGENEKMRQALSAIPLPHVHVFGFIDDIHELMAVSDMLITKPGGVSTFEALAMNLPMILIDGIPGQEDDNASFLTEMNLAIRVHDFNSITEPLMRRLLLQTKTDVENFEARGSTLRALDAIFI